MRCGSLFHRAAIGIQTGGTFEMRCGVSEPSEPVVVQMRKDRRDGAAGSVDPGKLRTSGLRIEARENQLIHCVIDGVGFQKNIAKLGHWFFPHGSEPALSHRERSKSNCRADRPDQLVCTTTATSNLE